MRSRAFTSPVRLALVAGVLVAAMVVAAGLDPRSAATGAPPPERPNVIVVQLDDARSNALRFMPAARRLFTREGTRFQRHFATTPLCCPSRASFLTGQYTHNHGVKTNSRPDGGYQALDHSETLPVWLQRSGYYTGHIGKYLNGYAASGVPDPPGWDEVYGSPAGVATIMYGYNLRENGELVSYGEAEEDYQTDVYAAKAASFITARSGRDPFFLSVNPSVPHTENGRRTRVGPDVPRNPRPAQRHYGAYEEARLPQPPSFNERDVSDKPPFIRDLSRISPRNERSIRRRHISRSESLLAVDDMIGEIAGALDAAGELERTVLILTSDHGYFEGEHRLRKGKAKLYEEAVRIPLAVRGPGFPAGATRRALTANIDLAPTILDLAGASPQGRTPDGTSLLPIAESDAAAGDRAILLESGATDSTGIRTERWMYAENPRSRELYDLRRDPFQLESRHGDRRYARTRRELAEQLGWLRRCSDALCRKGRPRAELVAGFERDRTRRGEVCAASRVSARVEGPDVGSVSKAVFSFNGKRLKLDRKAPFSQPLRLRELRRRADSRLSVALRLGDGRRLTLERRLPPRCS